MSIAAPPVAVVRHLSQHYRDVTALDDVSIALPSGCVIGLIGPDGVGKSSLLSILAGARAIQRGEIVVLGADMADRRARERACPRIAYMPQGLGKNLYPDLSVRENIAFFARLFGQSRAERDWRIAELMEATALSDFADRPAKKLSGGMKQKLGLCCSLIHDPDLLILDEPTTGVDPLSRRQFWDLIDRLRARSATAMSVVVATAYMEEAERFDWLIAMNDGRILATGTPAELKAQTAAQTIEDAFVALLPLDASRHQAAMPVKTELDPDHEMVIVARDLTCRFGDFTAVDRVNFQIRKGEIFGFVGSNGCGKTTTMKMLTGLLPPTAGEALIFGRSMEAGNHESRRRVGYMSQAFSLYGELTVRQNLVLHARLFHLPHDFAEKRIAELIDRCDLTEHVDGLAAELPLGIRQRLSLAVAIVHAPDLLILDEPTSGVDPVARNQFWRLLIELSRNDDMTIFVSTHFMNEAARCDRLSLMHDGRVLATDTPDGLIRAKGAQTLEDAFVAFLEQDAGLDAPPKMPIDASSPPAPERRISGKPARFSLRRLFAYTIREGLELVRDPIRLMFALFGTAFLMIVFGVGISTDVNDLTFAALDRDQTPESRAYLAELRGSPYFVEKRPLVDYADLERRMKAGDIMASIEIPPNFGLDIKRGRTAFVSAWIDGSMPFRAETIRGYLEGTHQLYLGDPAVKTTRPAAASPVNTEIRFKYNQAFNSIYAMVPTTIALLLALFPAILMALAVVREKELGSITNLYVTPVTRLEFLLGKQLPYVGVALVNFAVMFGMATLLFNVPLRGAILPLLTGTIIYVFTTTAYGMLISTFCRTQIAALFGTAILTVLPATQFSGMLVPVSSLSGVGRIIGMGFPMTYFRPISVGTFTKGLGFADLGADILILLVFIPVLIGLSLVLLPKQDS
ncbi:ribosome-associated ATPase/putative transporter RbbA [Bradyrhizobium sp. 83012]|uniref:Ribosome-associated ATPase/putative transporter RbbA n=1 Tax=Bradyrhizobium aeschynomenes TaxID=2734909 RepID=A0ABX2CB64_9BRAD|nr:ribosome-associated ATPase/putative transporter RbbA [Bradyrhizobium aeschynomenes]NPU65471.1 ribosome-associated ATPase/putative transporter RbbA [Bradyrhizobium aeschynomenes]